MTALYTKDFLEVTVKKHHDSIYINDVEYELVTNYKEAFDRDVFEKRYTQLLDKYPYIVGDWGHEQLRLKGFYTNRKEIPFEKTIAYLQEYLIEYCSFGCRYFVLKIVHEELIQKNSSEYLKTDIEAKIPTKVNFKGKSTQRYQKNYEKNKTLEETTPNTFKSKSTKNVAVNEKVQQKRKKNHTKRKHPFIINRNKTSE